MVRLPAAMACHVRGWVTRRRRDLACMHACMVHGLCVLKTKTTKKTKTNKNEKQHTGHTATVCVRL